jgi:two-component system OmpR family sensor kinase
MEALFRPFFRGSNAARAEGHGLGLALARRAVQAHGGEITLSNASGGGLEPWVTLPLDDPGPGSRP